MKKPDNLDNIYHNQAGTFCFRVRHVDSLEDFCIFGKNDYLDSWFKAIRLDYFGTVSELNPKFSRYILLSSKEEINFLASWSPSQLVSVVIDAYREMFGEFGDD